VMNHVCFFGMPYSPQRSLDPSAVNWNGAQAAGTYLFDRRLRRHTHVDIC
jgi:hypothetical protein